MVPKNTGLDLSLYSKPDWSITMIFMQPTTQLIHFHVLRGHAKFVGYMGPVQMGYGAMAFSTHINNGAGTFFRKHKYGANIFSFIFMHIFSH